MDKEFVIVNEERYQVVGTADSLDEARELAERSAHFEPGNRFYLYQLTGSVFEEKRTEWHDKWGLGIYASKHLPRRHICPTASNIWRETHGRTN